MAKLKFLEVFLDSYEYDFYTPESVVNEIQTKDDEASQYLLLTIQQKKLKVRATNLTSLVISLNARLGIGEAEAIALGTELQANYIILVIFPPEKQL